MDFHFSSQAKNNISEFMDLTLFLVTSGALLSFMARRYWFFNLFDQFWSFYLITSIGLVLIFFLFKKNARMIVSLIVCITCSGVFYKMKRHPFVKHESNFKIYYHNINSSNIMLEELSNNSKNSNAEILVLVEATPKIESVLTRNLGNYTNQYSLARDDNFGFLILSKINFKLEEVHERLGTPIYLKFFVEKYNIKIYLLHLPPPLWREAWETQRETLELIANEVNRNKNQSFLILGDFNMTTPSSQFQDFYQKLNPNFNLQELLFQGTWPSFMPEYLRLPIDHILSNRNFEIEIGSFAGSDHRSMIIKVTKG